MEYVTHSEKETIDLGIDFGKKAKNNSIYCFSGELASGKTTFIKGFVSGATGYPIEDVNSPTFTYLNVYKNNKTVYHFDLYRIDTSEEFFMMGFDEYFDIGGICCIEWSEKISEILPHEYTAINLFHYKENSRKIVIDP